MQGIQDKPENSKMVAVTHQKNKNKAPTFSLSVCVSENFIAFSLNPRVSEMIFLEFGRGKWETENARKEKGKVVRREMASGYGE
jgi:hypothetical protein